MLCDADAVVLTTLDADGDGDADLLAGGPLLLWRNECHGKLVPHAIPTPADWGKDVEDLTTTAAVRRALARHWLARQKAHL